MLECRNSKDALGTRQAALITLFRQAFFPYLCSMMNELSIKEPGKKDEEVEMVEEGIDGIPY